MSLATTSSRRVAICHAPAGTTPPGHSPTGVSPTNVCSGSTAKLIRNGTQARVKTPAKMLRAEPAAPSRDRQIRTATLLSSIANRRLSGPPK